MKKGFIFTIILLALIACTTPPVQTPEPTATGIPLLNMPNPASVYCERNGNIHEIQTSADGSQSGICVFSDGSICDEWVYFRGECIPHAKASPSPTIAVEETTEADGANSEGNASSVTMPPATSEEITDWWGIIKSTPPGTQYDDYFERQDLRQIIFLGISSMDPAVQDQIKTLRDSGKIVHLYGTLLSNVPDCNGSQIQVDRIEFE